MTTRQRVFPRAGVSQRRALVVFLFVSLVLAALCVNAYSAPATIFSDDFDHAFTGWTIKGTPDWNFLPPTIGLRSIRLRKKEAIKRTISTVGYQDITVSFYLGAWSLDKKKEYVCAEWNGGSGWQILKKIKDHDPEEDRHLHYFEYALPAGASNNAAFALRFRIHGNGNRDYGWVDEVVVQGEPIQYTLSLDGVGGAVAVNGSIQSLPWSGVFDGGEVVTLEAVPNPGFEFTGWSGDLTGADNPAAITMSSDKNVTAEFALHLVTVSAACDPSTVPSGGAADLSAVFDDSLGHSAASWHWDDGGAGGTFSPSADVQNPTYTAPENLSDDDLAVTLSVSALCDGSHPKRGSGSVTLTVEPIAHTLSVTASDDPDTVPSGGTTSLTAAYTDSRGHDIASWHWDDGGAGGSFSPSAEVQNPTYTAPVNTDDDERNVVLTVTATCDGPDPISASDSVNLDVDPVPHTLTVTASVDPPALESGGAASLTASYDDSRGHEIDSWHWDDGGAGGSFSPSADVQNPTYHAPENHGDTDVMVTLTVTATCAGETPLTASDAATLTVRPVPHSVSVNVSASPDTVDSEGESALSATFSDTHGHDAASWAWDDGGAGGSFSPSADVQNPTYTAPENTGDADLSVTLTVTATCDGPDPASGSRSVSLTVHPVPHELSVSASAAPQTVESEGTTNLSAAYTDSHGHDIASWHWDDGGAGGSFSPSAEVQNPTYTAPQNLSEGDLAVTLTVAATCDSPLNGGQLTATDATQVTVHPVDHKLTVSASASPGIVASAGSTDLSAAYADSRGHGIASWQWDDGGAGGTFSPSAEVQNPTYTAPVNDGDDDMLVTLTVTATCDGPTPETSSDSVALTVQPAPHTLSVSAAADPEAVNSGGATSLSATYADSRGHGIASWSWDDGGAGGIFSPSADVQNPTYTAPANPSPDDMIVTLTVTATCDGSDPETASDSVALTVRTGQHSLSVEAQAAPTMVDSGGTTDLTATAVDTAGHDIASWHWDDGGAGGSFSPSAEVQNPTYTAPQNLSEGDLAVTLTVAATCDSPLNGGQLTATDATQVTVHPVDHKLTVSASASPGIVASAGSTDLSAAYADSRGHGIASWQWDDGGAGGTFSPSAEVQNPTYTAPVNDGDDDMLVTLTVTATCDGPTPETSSDSVALTVQPAPHTLSVSAAADPEAVNSGGATSLSATYADSRGHGIASWSWDDGGAGGIFSPSADVQNPTYTAPANPSPDDMIVTLTVTATCDGSDPETASDSVALTVRTGQHSLSVEAQAAPTMVDSGGTTDLTATAVDTAGHDIASWHWDDGGAGGTFSPSADVENPTYTAPVNSGSDDMTVTLTVSATCCGSPSLTASGTVEVTVLGPASHASVVDVEAPESLSRGDSASAEIVLENTGDDAWTETRGFALGPYQGIDRWGVTPQTLEDDVSPGCQATFDVEVTAPPLSTLSYSPPVSPEQPGRTDGIPLNLTLLHGDRAVEGALVETNVVISRFPDIQPGTEGEWARFYVEECAGRVPMVVQGFPEGDYRPSLAVDRAAMAVYMARSLNLKIGSYQGTFVDVPATHWAAPYIEALAAAGLVQGFDDGTYRPSLIVTRDQMAVYTARGVYGALDLPPGPDTPSFPDVPTDYWAYDAIEYAVAHGIVHGYDDGTYRPSKEVTRDQMAVYVYRAFIQSRASGVILGGPAIAASDPAADDYYGWAAVAGGPASDPGYAYVVFDAARLGAELAHDGSWDIKFELRAAAAPNNPAAGDYTAVCSLSAANIEAARNAALSSGVPYLAVSWDIPSGLAAGDYVLVVSVEDQDGNMNEVNLRPEFTITP